jgi:hypothetical protein
VSEQKKPEANELQKADDRAAKVFAERSALYEAHYFYIARHALEAVRRVMR